MIGWVSDVPPEWFWIKLVFVAIPLLALPWGWWVLKSRTTVEITAEQVTWQRTTPLGQRQWQAPLTEFAGLRLRKVLPSTTSQDRQARYAVELDHAERKPRLTHTKDERLARQVLDRVSALTGLAILED